ncbi:MAG: hypothetical protein ABI237_09480 [Ginsengibacter sp.]
MEKATEILNELKSISPLIASIEKVNVFRVPDGYFNIMEQQILTSAFLSQNKKEYMQAPEGYFDTLTSRILEKVKSTADNTAEEIKFISPLLYSLKSNNVFTVPENYFEELSTQITGKLNHKEKAKIISIHPGKKWWKYAAAAVITGVIVISSLQIFNHNTLKDPDSVITASVNIPDYIKLSFQYNTPEQLNEGIASLSDDEIARYLEKSGNITDDEQLSAGIDTQGMPSPDDYLMDENTLNNYLNMINAQNLDKNTP